MSNDAIEQAVSALEAANLELTTAVQASNTSSAEAAEAANAAVTTLQEASSETAAPGKIPLAGPNGTIADDYIKFMQSGDGAVLRRMIDKAREFVSVTDFGAAGDGVTDDRLAFQKTVNFAVLNNKRVYVPDGNFLLDSIDTANPFGCAVFVASDVGISVECSPNANIIAGPNLGSAIAGYLGNGAVVRIQRIGSVTGRRVIWEGGRFDLSLLPSGTTGCDGLSIGPKYQDVIVDSVIFDHGITTASGSNIGVGGGDSSLFCKEPENISVTKCQFLGPPDLGVYLSGDPDYPNRIGRHAYISGNYFTRCGGGTVAGKRQFEKIIVTGNQMFENGGGVFLGIADSSTTNTGSRIVVTSNIIHKTQGNPLRISNSESAIVVGNEIFDYRRWLSDGTTETSVSSGNVGAAVLLEGCENFTVTGNVIGFLGWDPVTTINKFTVGVSLATFGALSKGCSKGAVVANSVKDVYSLFFASTESTNNLLSPNKVTGALFPDVLQTVDGNSSVDLLGDIGTGFKWFADGIFSAMSNSAEVARFNGVASAVNRVELVNSIAGSPVEIRGRGSDTYVHVKVTPRGSQGTVMLDNVRQFADDTAAAAGGVPITGLYMDASGNVKIRAV